MHQNFGRKVPTVTTGAYLSHIKRVMGKESLCELLGINEENLRFRREFLGLGVKEQQLMRELTPWVEKSAIKVTRRLYEFQFSFPRTKTFFERFAASRNMPVQSLREHLEKTQAQSIIDMFRGAKESWGVAYFERRAHIGMVHDRINLPLKWYLGTYPMMERFLAEELEAVENDQARLKLATQTISKVFNYDIQVVSETFVMAFLGSLGISMRELSCRPEEDRSEKFGQLKESVAILPKQAEAIANLRFGDPILQQRTPGTLGEAFGSLVGSLNTFSEQIIHNADALNVVASSSEEMLASIKEITRVSSDTSRSVRDAVNSVDDATKLITQLGDASAQIGRVVKVIKGIAAQTNLLALNATIEAARAGQSGKGFAVVANEVKELAGETGVATDDIVKQIDSIQKATESAVAAVTYIRDQVRSIDELSLTLSSAVEEQSITTNEITRSVTETARGTQKLASALLAGK